MVFRFVLYLVLEIFFRNSSCLINIMEGRKEMKEKEGGKGRGRKEEKGEWKKEERKEKNGRLI